ncbi:hypothetical protein A6A04_18350 [Paramagnetospirillum marisnigri]|uniref:4'-phosphopantetheinyl transferase domain-containing protein n=1 Tax=Paramagnetospirillum marisnigri TaxID=1285242 RepID=A0A178MNR9_9PROT|nr:4'-phosphopantetheinyl transferase superfamily protein [Paramagnetospirillum marisnigri]OAN50442.1 hypothetical protein A6A04_18350 [Paramagnetospirillum marisnigri]
MESIALDMDTRLYTGIADSAAARRDLLRRNLAETLGVEADGIEFDRDAAGKPVLVAPDINLWFSTASRDGVMVIAQSRRGPVGVDVETLGRCDSGQNVADALFSASEAHWLRAQPTSERDMAFGRLWTAKEAVLKAMGVGIADGMNHPDFGDGLVSGPPPWPSVVAELGSASYTVVWYTSMVDEAFIIAARAEPSAGRSFGMS